MATAPTPPLTEELMQRFRQVAEEEANRIFKERLDEIFFFGEYAPHLQHQTSKIKHPKLNRPSPPCKIQNPNSKIQN